MKATKVYISRVIIGTWEFTGRRRFAIRYGEADWAAVRAEYVAGGVGQKKLAAKHGLPYGALRRRAVAEGWVALRDGGSAVKPPEPARDGQAPAADPDPGEAGIALRLRRKLLSRLEKMADEIPDGAVTEYKTQDDSAVKLFKLRDLTAAYKELAGDIPAEDGDRDAARVIIDV